MTLIPNITVITLTQELAMLLVAFKTSNIYLLNLNEEYHNNVIF